MVTQCSLPRPRAAVSANQSRAQSPAFQGKPVSPQRAHAMPPWSLGRRLRQGSFDVFSLDRTCIPGLGPDARPRSWARAARSPAEADGRALASSRASNLKGSAGLAEAVVSLASLASVPSGPI